MRHCCTFDALDIWYLKNNEVSCNRVLYIGFCPRCHKPVVELIQKNIKSHTYSFSKKVGIKAHNFVIELIPEKVYAKSDVYKKNISQPYGWKYGINKEVKLAQGVTVLRQYASDFYGNTALIKTIT